MQLPYNAAMQHLQHSSFALLDFVMMAPRALKLMEQITFSVKRVTTPALINFLTLQRTQFRLQSALHLSVLIIIQAFILAIL